MTKLEKIEQSIAALDPEDLRAFANWFAEFQSNQWDTQIEQDVAAGRMERFADEALNEHRAGRTRAI